MLRAGDSDIDFQAVAAEFAVSAEYLGAGALGAVWGVLSQEATAQGQSERDMLLSVLAGRLGGEDVALEYLQVMHCALAPRGSALWLSVVRQGGVPRRRRVASRGWAVRPECYRVVRCGSVIASLQRSGVGAVIWTLWWLQAAL